MSIYSLLLWTALDVLRGPPRMPAITDAHAPLLPRMLRLRRAGLAAWAVLGVTVLSGAHACKDCVQCSGAHCSLPCLPLRLCACRRIRGGQ